MFRGDLTATAHHHHNAKERDISARPNSFQSAVSIGFKSTFPREDHFNLEEGLCEIYIGESESNASSLTGSRFLGIACFDSLAVDIF